MSAENFYYLLKNKSNLILSTAIKTIFLSIFLLLGGSVLAYGVPPVFSGGSTQSLSVCANSGATNIDSFLTINAIPPGQNETWSVSISAVHGTLNGFNTNATTTGSPLTPNGLTYTPTVGYSGMDSFTIQVSDGINSATTTILVTIYPMPTLTSTQTPAPICSGTIFSYMPESDTSGAAFTWSRAFVNGISTPAARGTGSISETLSNITYYDVTATYVYTLSANGCKSIADVMVEVKPTPTLTGGRSETICSGALFDYTVSSNTTGTTISWSRPAVPDISPDTSSGTGNISETLTNTSSTTQNAIYVFSLSANGCSATRDLVVTVEPPVPATGITTASPSSACSNTLYQNFGTANPPSAGISYVWGAENAAIFARGYNNQYILVNFNEPGYALITLTTSILGTSCNSKDSFLVNVGSATSSSSNIMYINNQFIYLDNTVSSYQWGYDNASSLDSTLIPGATFQSYTDSTPDFTDNYYWVITTEGGCMEKTYYNSPLAVNNIQSANQESIKVYPNPADNNITIDINVPQTSVTTVTLSDMMGRILKTITGEQQTIQFDVSDIPAGCYLFTCYNDGVKMATTRFIKK